MRTITMLELRREAGRWIDAIRRGERLLLTYRGQPVARIEPVRDPGGDVPEDDPLLRVDDFAVDGPGGHLTNEAVDRLIYGA
jgi:antitoxin (DNA-binding transcriptional repressor) of toxin-antitoxin stability system